MATSKKKEPIDSKTTTEEPQQVETLQEEVQQDVISDRKLILAPLVKYGAVAFVIASIIVTTAVMMNSDFNDVDNHVATVETEIAQQNATEQLAEQETTRSIENTSASVETLATNEDTTIVAIDPEVALPVATAPVTLAPVIMPSQGRFKAFNPKARFAEHNEFMVKQDQKYLESFKTSQARHIEMLRKQLAQQQARIDAIEKRNTETYEMREASIKRMQEHREQSLNRI